MLGFQQRIICHINNLQWYLGIKNDHPVSIQDTLKKIDFFVEPYDLINGFRVGIKLIVVFHPAESEHPGRKEECVFPQYMSPVSC